MKKIIFALLAFLSIPAFAGIEIGQTAPDFATVDTAGNSFTLSAQKGKIVVLEWYNQGCPFVRAHYDAKNMQSLQQYAKDKGVVWVSINSSAKGKEGYLTNEEAASQLKKEGSKAGHLVLDPYGDIGKKYEAKTTPHMFVIDREGKLVYMGAIDDKGGAKGEEIKKARNYIESAITALLANQKPEPAVTKPYGCAVKYAD